jgi:hypothetical protein
MNLGVLAIFFFSPIFHEINSLYFKIFHSDGKRVNLDMQTCHPRRKGWLKLKVKRRKLPKHPSSSFFSGNEQLIYNNSLIYF